MPADLVQRLRSGEDGLEYAAADEIERLLALVEAARRDEREACAELVRLWPVDSLAEAYSIYMLSGRDDDMAAAIRARSTEEQA